MPSLEAVGRSNDVTVEVMGWDQSEYYEVSISFRDLEIEFGSVYPPMELKDLLDKTQQELQSPTPHREGGGPLKVIRDTEFPDRYWLTNNSNSNRWTLKRTAQEIEDLIKALEDILKDYVTPPA